MKILLLLPLLAMGCATTPAPRKVKLEVDWIRSTVSKDYFGYRHAERAAPLIDGRYLYQGSGLSGIVAFDRITGNTLWKHSVEHGVESGLAVDGELLYFGASDGYFYAINKRNAKTVWSFPTRVETLATPLIHQGIVYFLAGNNVVYALDAKTGKQIWIYNRGDLSSLSIRGGTKPALYNGTLYVGFSDGFLVSINSRDGSVLWERKITSALKFVDVDATPIVDEEFIWTSSFDGALVCLSRKDGQVQWRMDEGSSVPVTISGDILYYASLDQTIYALNKKTGVQKWKFTYHEDDGVPTQPVLYRGMVVVGASQGDLMFLSEHTGKLLASYRPGAGVFATPLADAARNRVYIFSNEANLHVLKVAWAREGDG